MTIYSVPQDPREFETRMQNITKLVVNSNDPNIFHFLLNLVRKFDSIVRLEVVSGNSQDAVNFLAEVMNSDSSLWQFDFKNWDLNVIQLGNLFERLAGGKDENNSTRKPKVIMLSPRLTHELLCATHEFVEAYKNCIVAFGSSINVAFKSIAIHANYYSLNFPFYGLFEMILKDLDFSYVRILNSPTNGWRVLDVDALASHFVKTKNLRAVILKDTQFGDAFMKRILQSIRSEELIYVDFSGNNITDKCVTKLNRFFEDNSRIAFANLESNKLTFDRFEPPKNVIELNISKNKVKNMFTMCKLIAELRRNRTLKVLRMNECGLNITRPFLQLIGWIPKIYFQGNFFDKNIASNFEDDQEEEGKEEVFTMEEEGRVKEVERKKID